MNVSVISHSLPSHSTSSSSSSSNYVNCEAGMRNYVYGYMLVAKCRKILFDKKDYMEKQKIYCKHIV